ncbi:glycosyltransferase family 2 protein [Natranaerobius thermophilus]|uniref:Glucosyl-3-phosphoglycerate synthase n=1 Tax=Natranaerobius thermophilus (strain ATCC BAA-1301 / DSM 18059 / JW/NM-WN-LF) TaxID=457570 RepID=B2A517_NATTJ|nr:glycosyltransferase family 2 protein [Natranaerobius thermophilus]ACB85259.1 glycosyl transferase family 2 [Natranaerobius thermophilus JW/NM-WN-LF]
MTYPKVSAIIPACNEGNNIVDTIRGLQDLNEVNEIIVVDDGSKDETFELAKAQGVSCVKLDKNYGKGKALYTGVESSDSQVVAFVDADLGQTAKKIKSLITPVVCGEADMAIVKFPKEGNYKYGGFGLVKKLAKTGTYLLTGKVTEASLSGQRVINRELAKQLLELEIDSGYGVELGMTVEALKREAKVIEVEENMSHRKTGKDLQGFLHRGKQFIQILITLLRKKFVQMY